MNGTSTPPPAIDFNAMKIVITSIWDSLFYTFSQKYTWVAIVVFLVLFKLFGDSVIDDIVIALISIAVYPLVGMLLRAVGVWRY